MANVCKTPGMPAPNSLRWLIAPVRAASARRPSRQEGPDPRLGAEPLRRGWATSPASAPIRFCAFPAAASGPACPATCAKPTASSATTGSRETSCSSSDPLAPQHESLTPGWELLFKVSPIDAVERPIGNAAPPSRPARATVPDRRGQRDHPPSVRRRLGQTVDVRDDKGRPAGSRTYAPRNAPLTV